MENWIWLLFLIFPAFIGLLFFFQHRYEKARREALHDAAQRLVLNFLPEGDADVLARLGSFSLGNHGRSQRLTNLMRGTHGDLEVTIFDYRYVTGSGKHSTTHRQTALVLAGERTALATFSLRPENFFHKIGAWFGGQDIDFESRPDFSSQYVLQGPDESAVRRLFQGPILDFFEARPGFSVECDGSRLLVYRHNRRADPEEVSEFLSQGRQILDLLQPWRF